MPIPARCCSRTGRASRRRFRTTHYALRRFRALFGDAPLPDRFVTAQDLTPAEHVRVQAAVQEHVDSAISKTVNVLENIGFEAFQEVYRDADRSGCKGCTTYRPNAITGSVLEVKPASAPAVAAPPAVADIADLMVRSDKLRPEGIKAWPLPQVDCVNAVAPWWSLTPGSASRRHSRGHFGVE